jgi:hypothetical protein
MSYGEHSSGGQGVFWNGEPTRFRKWCWSGLKKDGANVDAALVTWMKEAETWYSSVPEAGKSSLPKQQTRIGE